MLFFHSYVSLHPAVNCDGLQLCSIPSWRYDVAPGSKGSHFYFIHAKDTCICSVYIILSIKSGFLLQSSERRDRTRTTPYDFSDRDYYIGNHNKGRSYSYSSSFSGQSEYVFNLCLSCKQYKNDRVHADLLTFSPTHLLDLNLKKLGSSISHLHHLMGWSCWFWCLYAVEISAKVLHTCYYIVSPNFSCTQ